MTPLPRTDQQLVGRDRELARVVEFLRDPRAASLVVQGPQGFGKSRLIDEALLVVGDEIVVARMAALASDRAPYSSALTVADSLAQVDRLRAPMERLRGMLRDRRSGPDPRPDVDFADAIVEMLANAVDPTQPIVTVCDEFDDADDLSRALWLVLAERAASHPWKVIFTARDQSWAASSAPHADTLSLGELDPAAVCALLEQASGYRVATPVASRIQSATGGNPLVVRELATQLSGAELSGLELLRAPLPITPRIAEFYRDQLAGVDQQTLAAISMFAFVDAIETSSLGIALGGLDQVDKLVDAGVMAEQNGRVRLEVPLIAAVAARMTSIADRSVIARCFADELDHERLLFTIIDHESPPDSWMREATRQLRRNLRGRTTERIGTLAVVAEARAASVRDGEFWTALGLAYGAAGAVRGAQRAADQVGHRDAAGLSRVELYDYLLSLAELQGGDIGVLALLGDGWSDADKADTRVNIAMAFLLRGDRAAARSELEQARELADRTPDHDDARLDLAERVAAIGSSRVDEEHVLRDVFAQADDGRWRSPLAIVAIARALMAAGQADPARALLRLRATWDATETQRATYLAALAEIEAWSDRPHRSLEIIRELEATLPMVYLESIDPAAALIRSHAATGEGRELLDRFDGPGGSRGMSRARAAAMGYHHLAAGEYQAAIDVLRPMVRGAPPPHLYPDALANLVEALVAAGRAEDARRELAHGVDALDALDNWHTRMFRLRCAALVAPAAESDDAFAAAAAACRGVDGHALVRTIIAQARVLGIDGRDQDAAAALGRAELACRDWRVEGWRAEVERIRHGLATPSCRDQQQGGLTIDEQQVVDLVAQGLRNREIAAQLYVSLRTVEATLTKIYRKVDVANRSELVAQFGRPADDAAQDNTQGTDG